MKNTSITSTILARVVVEGSGEIVEAQWRQNERLFSMLLLCFQDVTILFCKTCGRCMPKNKSIRGKRARVREEEKVRGRDEKKWDAEKPRCELHKSTWVVE